MYNEQKKIAYNNFRCKWINTINVAFILFTNKSNASYEFTR